jgi:hypothetical protein
MVGISFKCTLRFMFLTHRYLPNQLDKDIMYSDCPQGLRMEKEYCAKSELLDMSGRKMGFFVPK